MDGKRNQVLLAQLKEVSIEGALSRNAHLRIGHGPYTIGPRI